MDLGDIRRSEVPLQEATSCLQRITQGDRAARNQLFEVLYTDLRAQAAALLRQERAEHTLQPTALVHESWLRLIDQARIEPTSKGHFLALAAQAMRRILVDHARTKKRDKRGGDWARVELADALPSESEGLSHLDLLDIDEGLSHLREQSEHLASIAELRFFGGLSNEETAEALGLSRATVVRDWRVAKALLSARMKGPE